MEQAISKILSILEECDQAIEIAQLVLFAVITKKCSNVSKAVKTSDIAVPVEAVKTSDVAVPSVKSIEKIESLAASDMKTGIDLYLSDVDPSKLSINHKRCYDLAVAYFEAIDASLPCGLSGVKVVYSGGSNESS